VRRRPTAPRRAVAAVAVCVFTGAVLGACGLPEDDEPRMISDGDVPFGLLETTTSTSVSTTVTR